jgi:hypothetical protein
VVIGMLGAAVVLGLSLATPTVPPEPESDLLQQAVWSQPIPSFLASGLGVGGAGTARRGLVPVDPPRALGVPVAAKFDGKASATPGGIPVRVFFSRHPDSKSAFSAVFPVTRLAADQAVATAALASLIKGPTDAERADGYFSELGGALAGGSSCSGHDFRIAIENGTATVRFCRAVTSAGVGQDARVRSQIEATLRQFTTVRSVRLISSTGRCLFDQSGQDRCLAGHAAAAPRLDPQAGAR